MGSHYTSIMIRATTEDDLRKQYKQIIQEIEYESGHSSYNGTLSTCRGLSVKKFNKFKTRGEADKWLEENTEKWESAVAVRCSKSPAREYDPCKNDWVKARRGHWWVIGGHVSE